jgi:hypothetical protein
MFNYHNKTFRSLSNTSNGEVGNETFFYYQQSGNIVTASYKGGSIEQGHLIAIVEDNGSLNMRYHHVNTAGELMTGVCNSIPELLPNGKLQLIETWQWTSGDKSSGTSIIEEI